MMATNPAPMIAIAEECIWADSDSIEETIVGIAVNFRARE